MLVAVGTTGSIAVWSLILCGLANSIMYPTIFALGIAELGPMTSKGLASSPSAMWGGCDSAALWRVGRRDWLSARFILPIICYST